LLLRRLWLTDFRSYPSAEVTFADGLTAIVGANGAGKTNLLEAIGWLAAMRSFRGVPTEALVRQDAERAVVRAEVEHPDRTTLIEAELIGHGRNRVQVNRQRLARARDLVGALRVTVFSPDDLALVKGGPSERRRYLDDTLVALHPRHDALQREVERVLAQRNALLRQAKGRLDESAAFTLDVWDAKLAASGEELAAARERLVDTVGPAIRGSYASVASLPEADVAVDLWYRRSWAGPLSEALATGRGDDVRRSVSLVGPHRDELEIGLSGRPARTHASQGEQRALALALRLAGHTVVTEAVGSPPILLLDDVFSELDPDRAHALLVGLPAGQKVLTTAGGLPPGARPDRLLRIVAGVVEEGR
jgi:DNA replication and repair protein RecF